MLLLIYVLLTTYFIAVTLGYFVYEQAEKAYFEYLSRRTKINDLMVSMGVSLIYLMNIMIAFLVTAFLKFHIHLTITNKTTIENLEKQNTFRIFNELNNSLTLFSF